MKGSNSKQNKALNLRLVLSEIVTQAPVSRIEISRRTHLTKQTITNMVEELIASNLVIEMGLKKEGTVGKPSKMLSINPKQTYNIALRVFSDKIEAGVFSLLGEQLAFTSSCLQEEVTNEAYLLAQMSGLYQQLLNESQLKDVNILGAGLSFASNKHHDFATYNYQLSFRQKLAEKLGLPLASETTAAACAAYQMLYGEAKQLHSFVCVHISDVVEAAVVYDRKILLGQNGLTGAIGELFVTPEMDDKTVELGRLNDFASLTSLKQYLGLEFKSNEELAEYCQHNQSKLAAWFERAAEPMRIAIHSLETLLNCQTIIVSGDVSSWFLDKFITHLRPYIPSIAQYGDRDLVRVIKTTSVEQVALRGTATLSLHAALSREEMQTLALPQFKQLTTIQSLVFN